MEMKFNYFEKIIINRLMPYTYDDSVSVQLNQKRHFFHDVISLSDFIFITIGLISLLFKIKKEEIIKI